MKPKNFPGRKYRRQLRANMVVLEKLGVPITWEMRSIAHDSSHTDVRIRCGAKNRDEHGQVMRHRNSKLYGGRSADLIVHDDIMDATRYEYALMRADAATFQRLYPSTAQLWKASDVTP